MRYLEELKKLKLPKNKYAVFGSGPLAIRGLRENKDIDIIVKKDLWNELEKKYKKNTINSIKVGNIEFYRDWNPWIKELDLLINDSNIINGIRYVKIKYVLEWKEKRNEEKDKKDIKLIKSVLK